MSRSHRQALQRATKQLAAQKASLARKAQQRRESGVVTLIGLASKLDGEAKPCQPVKPWAQRWAEKQANYTGNSGAVAESLSWRDMDNASH